MHRPFRLQVRVCAPRAHTRYLAARTTGSSTRRGPRRPRQRRDSQPVAVPNDATHQTSNEAGRGWWVWPAPAAWCCPVWMLTGCWWGVGVGDLVCHPRCQGQCAGRRSAGVRAWRTIAALTFASWRAVIVSDAPASFAVRTADATTPAALSEERRWRGASPSSPSTARLASCQPASDQSASPSVTVASL